MAEAQDVRSLAQIYKSGDLMLQNPAESCIIFVSVIMVSALLEFVLQKAGSIDNKYARMMVETMTQEVTIVGVLALLLMFGISIIPRSNIQDRYITLFTWANMCLFFMAFFFVAIIFIQFSWAKFDLRRWRLFEEGRMDSEEDNKLSYRERVYKYAYQLYNAELQRKHGITAANCAFHKYIDIMLKRNLVRLSDLSYRTWLSLSVIVLANLARAKLTPFLKKGVELNTFGNAGMFIGVIGFGTALVWALFMFVLQRRLYMHVTNQLTYKVMDPSQLVPLGTTKRGVEFSQIVAMSINWYMTLFITGLGKDVADLTRWRLGIVVSGFIIPIIVVFGTLPWALLSITMLGILGNTKYSEVDRILRIDRGEIDEDSDEGDSDDEKTEAVEKAASTAQAASEKKSVASKGNSGQASEKASWERKAASEASDESHNAMERPAWLEADDEWNESGGKQEWDARFERMYLENVDPVVLKKMIQKKAPHLLEEHEAEKEARRRAAEEQNKPRQDGRPIWLDSDEEWDERENDVN